MRHSWAAFLVFILALSSSLALGDSESHLHAEMKRFSDLKAFVLSLGIPQDDNVAEYLTLELFYNIPFSKPVAASPTDVKVQDVEFNLAGLPVTKFKSRFPQWEKWSNDTAKLKGIRISGHESYFIWDPDQPEVHFILKPDEGASTADITMGIYEEASQRMPGLTFDYVIEDTVGEGHVIRLLKTARSQSTDREYPLHGFLGSPLFDQLAQRYNMSRYQFLRDKLMPHFADSMFEMVYRVGLWPSSHTQNLWMVINKDGQFHLAHKDYTAQVIDFFTRTSDPTHQNWSRPNLTGNPENDLTEAHTDVISEDPHFSNPANNFVSYAAQTILLADHFSTPQKITLLKAFLDRFIERIENHYGIKIKISDEFKELFNNPDRFKSDNEVSQKTVRTGHDPFERAGGFYALGERVMTEIQSQIYNHLVGARTYPKDRANQKILKDLYNKYEFYFPIKYPGFHRLSERGGKFKKYVVTPLFGLFRNLHQDVVLGTAHYEFTDKLILMVSSSGEVLRAMYYENAAAKLVGCSVLSSVHSYSHR